MICVHTVKWFQVLQLYGFNKLILNKRLNTSTWPTDGTLISITTPSQSVPENNGNEEVPHISKTLRLEPHDQRQFSVILRQRSFSLIRIDF